MASPFSKQARRWDANPDRRAARKRDPRVASALENARRAEAWVARQEASGKVETEAALKASRSAAIATAEREAVQKREKYPLSDARDLIRQGYSLAHVMRLTGWPEKDLRDVRPW